MCPISSPSSVCSGSSSAVVVYLTVCLPFVQVIALLAGSGTGWAAAGFAPSFMVTVKDGVVSAMVGSLVAWNFPARTRTGCKKEPTRSRAGRRGATAPCHGTWGEP